MLDRTLPPPFNKSASFHLPTPVRRRLAGGTEVFLNNRISQEVVKLEAVAEGGRWYESKSGQAHFTANMLEKGTRSMSATEVAEFFERHGASIEVASGTDFLSVSLYTLTRHLHAVVPVFYQLLTQPRFDENEFQLMKDIFLQTLRVNNEKTNYVASKLLKRNVFGAHHPYGSSIEEEDVASLRKEDLEVFFQNHIRFSKIFAIANFGIDQLAGALSSFEDGSAASDSHPIQFAPTKGPLFEKVEKKSSVQSSIRFGQRTIDRRHPDFPGLLLLNHYLGGFFGSQLMRNLREEKGLTYGVGSSIHSFRHDALFSIGTDVNKENCDIAIEQIRCELRRITQGEIKQDDLELSRRHFIGSIQSDIANPFSVLSKIKNLELNNLPVNYYEDLLTTVDTISLDRLRSIGSNYFSEEEFQTVAVG